MRALSNFLLIVIGGMGIIMAISVSQATQNDQDTFAGQFQNEFDSEYREEINRRNTGTAVLGVGGALLLIVGLIRFARGGKKEERKTSSDREVMRLQGKAYKHFNNREFQEAAGILRRLITLDPNEGIHHFNLACCLSELKSAEAMKHIGLAVSKGYTDFGKIRTYNSLSWIRKQDGYDEFVRNGYSAEFAQTRPAEAPNKEEKVTVKESTDDTISKLEKLASLKEKGLLSDEEFDQQKKKILNT